MTVPNAKQTSAEQPALVAELARTAAIGALSGALAGAVVGGVLGRLAMRLLAATSPDARGGITDDLAVVGRISMEGTVDLAQFTTASGLVTGLLYLLVRKVLPTSTAGRIGGFALFTGVVGGALMVHGDDSFDFSRLQPEWLSTSFFVLLPAGGGAATATLAEWGKHTRGWLSRVPTVALVGVAVLVSFIGMALLFVLPMVVLAFAVTFTGSLRRMWARRWVTRVGRAVLGVLLAAGVLDLIQDIASMAANRN